MKTKPLLDSGILNSGEPRHYTRWDAPQVPKLNLDLPGAVGQALYRRQRAHAPLLGQRRRGFYQILNVLRNHR